MVAISTRDEDNGLSEAGIGGRKLPDQRRLAHEPSPNGQSGQRLDNGQLAQRLSMGGRVVMHTNSRYEQAMQRFQQHQDLYEREANRVSKSGLHDAVFRDYMKRIGRA